MARIEQRPEQRTLPVQVEMDTLQFGLTATHERYCAAFPSDWIEGEPTRLDCYRRLNDLRSVEEVDRFEEELVDRFGPSPQMALRLLEVGRVRATARAAGVLMVRVRQRRALLETEAGPLRVGRRIPVLAATDADGQLTELIRFLRGQRSV